MHTAFGSGNIIGEGEDCFVVAVVILESNFGNGVILLTCHIDDLLVESCLVFIEMIYVSADTAFVMHCFGSFFISSVVCECDSETAIEEGLFTKSVKKCFVFEDCFFKNVCVRLECYLCTCLVCFAHNFERTSCDTSVEADSVNLALCMDFNFHPFGESINNRCANAVETARNLIAFAAELTAGVEDCINNFDSRKTCLWLDADRNTASVVCNCNGIVAIDRHLDMVTVACEGFVDGIIDDFVNQMVKTSDRSCTDVHTRTLTDGF